MTDQEFDVLDELYFVIPFEELLEAVDMEEAELYSILKELLKKKWVKCYRDHSEELLPHEVEIDHQYKEYSYLATKIGLLAHNGR
ncbi:MAG: transporter [Tunicatimonas sp.]|uniref:transporter n=1 Tax=Tunicatimonas sp. TaxID=1940096 RepID=UPI003C709FB1